MGDTIIITIMQDGGYYWLKWKDRRMCDAYGGNGMRTTSGVLFVNMQEITAYVNNELGLAALFEVE